MFGFLRPSWLFGRRTPDEEWLPVARRISLEAFELGDESLRLIASSIGLAEIDRRLNKLILEGSHPSLQNVSGAITAYLGETVDVSDPRSDAQLSTVLPRVVAIDKRVGELWGSLDSLGKPASSKGLRENHRALRWGLIALKVGLGAVIETDDDSPEEDWDPCIFALLQSLRALRAIRTTREQLTKHPHWSA